MKVIYHVFFTLKSVEVRKCIMSKKGLFVKFICRQLLGVKSKSYCTVLFQIISDIRDRKVTTAGPQTEGTN